MGFLTVLILVGTGRSQKVVAASLGRCPVQMALLKEAESENVTAGGMIAAKDSPACGKDCMSQGLLPQVETPVV